VVEGAPPGESLEGEITRFFGYSHDVLVIMDLGGRALVLSTSAERVLGYPVNALVGRRLLHWVHPEDRAEVSKQARALLEGDPIGDLDTRFVGADGTWVPIRWSLSLGPDRRIYAVGRDRTDQAQHQDALLRQEVAELRLRTAMELHDGILQTLTGAGLQIAVARKLIGSDPNAAETVLDTLGQSVTAEQREMRLYVDELKGRAPRWTDGTVGLPERIEALLDRVGAIWGLTPTMDIGITGRLGGEFGRQVLRIIQEAAVNAARHSAAKAVSVVVALEGSDVVISIADDGKGFSFLGEFDNDALNEKRMGPLSLKHRVEQNHGRLSINSSRQGSTVIVRLPVPQETGTEEESTP
jgi:PAS domain S-box-containing protein